MAETTQTSTQTPKKFENFDEFYAYYLDAHKDPRNLRLHFFGTSGVIATSIYALNKDPDNAWMYVVPMGAIGYGMAWIGHFFFEKNKPATFNNPFWSFRAGGKMYRQMLRRELNVWGREPKRTGKISHVTEG